MATINAINTTIPIPVASGGTGAITLTAHSLLLGEGTGAVTALGAATNGQLAIGSTGADPVLAAITAGSGITVTNGAGTITIASSGGGVTSLAGNSGGALTGALSLNTAHTNVTFAGSGSTITMDFSATTNLTLGDSITSLSGGTNNVGLGRSALTALVGGAQNVALGNSAGGAINSGNGNVHIGYQAGQAVTSCNDIVAIGRQAMGTATANNNNGCIAIGYNALASADSGTASAGNTAVGYLAGNGITTGNYNTFLGWEAGHAYATGTESSNICIGYTTQGTNNESNVLRIGVATGTSAGNLNKAFIAGINGIVVTGTPILISSSNQLGVAASSARFKNNITDMDDLSGTIYNLRPVTFTWNKSSSPGLADAPDDKQFGLIAEEVATIMPGVVVFDEDLKPFSVNYDRLIPMLLNEIQRLAKRVAALEKQEGL